MAVVSWVNLLEMTNSFVGDSLGDVCEPYLVIECLARVEQFFHVIHLELLLVQS